MYFTPTNNNTKTSVSKRGISDTLVLLVTILLFVITISFPILKVTAQTVLSDDHLVVSLTNRQYNTLLSFLFGRVGETVPEDAEQYIMDVDEYRVRIAQDIQKNSELVQALYILIEDFPQQLYEGYKEEIDSTKAETERLKVAIFPHVENDVSLSNAVIEKYNLYPSFTEWLISQINNTSVIDDLNNIQEKSSAVRKSLAVLYIKINSVTMRDR